ncbi:helix-turn-helix domain-containing protein [Streptomyces aureoversilis]|uniref:Helix-turn-helix domain-containing protein n=1 Tax=Streptomyces aureoversilis TaxID=67277 RepID=A0ABV9ZZM2_9ACTN
MSIVLSTASMPVTERLDYWRHTVGQDLLDYSTPGDTPFNGTVMADQLGPVRVSTTHAGPLRVRKTPLAIDYLMAEDYITVVLQDSGPLVIDHDDDRTLLRPGTLAFYDTTRPFTLNFPDHFRTHVFRIPRHMLGLRDTDLRRVARAPVQADDGTAALIIPFLSRLAAQAGTHRPHIRTLLARNTGDLLATLAAELLDHGTPDTGTDAANTTLRLRIKAFIEGHLSDPDLSPQTIAAAHHVSVRHVHRIFQAEDTTVSRWIQHRRLESCRRELDRPGRNAPAVTAIAHRFGFTSASHFSRTFRAAYGVSPREWRAAARRDAAATVA